MKKKLRIILISLVLAALLCGCGASGGGVNKSSGFAASDFTSSINSASGYSSEKGWAMDEAPEMAVEESWSSSAGPSSSSGSGVKKTGSNLPANVKLIYRANIDMESTEFDAALSGLNDLVESLGGYYENSELNNYSSYRHGYYVVRLPSENFDAFCSAVGGLAQINTISRSAEDVSEYYYDLESRLATQRTKLDRLQTLLEQATEMEDIISLEHTISDTELYIENLTGSLRKYDSLVGYATVNITLSEVYKLTEVEEPVIGFGAKLAQAFRSGSSRFAEGVQNFLLAIASGWIGWLVFIIIVVAALIVVRKIRRRRQAKYAAYAAQQTSVQPPYAPQAQPPQEQKSNDQQ